MLYLPRKLTTPRITVVGGAYELRTVVGLPSKATDEEFCTALDRIALGMMDAKGWADYLGLPRHSICARWRQHLRFLSPSEYAAEVGAAQAALETQRDPYGPPAVYIS